MFWEQWSLGQWIFAAVVLFITWHFLKKFSGRSHGGHTARHEQAPQKRTLQKLAVAPGKNATDALPFGQHFLLGADPASRQTRGNNLTALGYRTDKHLLSIAPSRTGKGRGLILPNLLDLPGHSVFVIDPKGENALVSAPYRREQGHEVLIFNPYGVFKEEFAARGFTAFQSFNPLATLDPDSLNFAADVADIAEALIYDSGGDTHWDEAARGLVEFLIVYLVVHPGETRTLRRLRAILAGGHGALYEDQSPKLDDQPADNIINRCILSAHPLLSENAGRYLENNREIQSIFSTAETQTRIFKNEAICAALEGGGSFNFAAIKNRKVSVYLILPSKHLITQARYLRLILLSAMSQFMEGEKGQHRVLLMLDEFANLGTLKVIENGYGLIAGHGVTLWAFVQNLTQLKNLYPKNWETFIANSAAVTVSNVNDVTTAQYFSRRAGRHEVQKTTFSAGRSSGDWELFRSSSSSSANTASVWEDALPVSTLYGAPENTLFAFLEGRAEPVICDKLLYDQDEPFKKRASPNPMHG